MLKGIYDHFDIGPHLSNGIRTNVFVNVFGECLYPTRTSIDQLQIENYGFDEATFCTQRQIKVLHKAESKIKDMEEMKDAK